MNMINNDLHYGILHSIQKTSDENSLEWVETDEMRIDRKDFNQLLRLGLIKIPHGCSDNDKYKQVQITPEGHNAIIEYERYRYQVITNLKKWEENKKNQKIIGILSIVAIVVSVIALFVG